MFIRTMANTQQPHRSLFPHMNDQMVTWVKIVIRAVADIRKVVAF